MKEIPITRLSFFQGFVVTALEDGSIPLDAVVVGSPIPLAPDPHLCQDSIAVDRLWFINFINNMLSTERLALHRDAEQSQRIIELLETLEELRKEVPARSPQGDKTNG